MIKFVGQGKTREALLACARVRLNSICGVLLLEASPLGLTSLRLAKRDCDDNQSTAYSMEEGIIGLDGVDTEQQAFSDASQHLVQACEQLDEYFMGQRRIFELDLAPYGTAFQHQVWHALVNLGYGSHCSYGDIAQGINNPKAVRAVGAANGANPIAIIVPCHRVIGKDGSLTGYAYGLKMKQQLLQLEGVEV